MNSITIITIVVVALLTVIIFGLAWIAYSSCIKSYKMEVNSGKHDQEIYKEYHVKKKSKKGLLGLIGSWVAFSVLLGLFVTGIAYKASEENFCFNNQVVLVIKSGSMSDFYDDNIALQYNYDRSLQFGVGDICKFNKISLDDQLVEGQVYGYKYKDIIITHRLVSYDEETSLCKFRGDNNAIYDGSVARNNVVYHYTGDKIPGLGAFILYAQSYFGMWSIAGITGIAISGEIVWHKIDNINKARDKSLTPPGSEPVKSKKERKKKHEK